MDEVTAYPEPASPPPALALPESLAYDLSLQNPNCVFQLLKKHYSRYTPEMSSASRDSQRPIPQSPLTSILRFVRRRHEEGGTIIYAVGWTQHTFGTQIIRTAAICSSYSATWARGGGVNALRGTPTFRAPRTWPAFSTLCRL